MKIRIDDLGTDRNTLIGNLKATDYEPVLHNNGKLFIRFKYDGMLDQLAADMHRNIEENNDNVVVIEGAEGSGKSNLAYWICKKFNPDFDMNQDYVYDFETFKKKISSGKDQHGCFWLDETSNLANNRDWNTQNNKHMIELLEMMRSRKWTLVMCIPHKERLDVYIRENRIKYQLTCAPYRFKNSGIIKRGVFELQKKNIYGHMQHVGYGTYDKIPKEEAAIYEALKLRSQETKINEIVYGEEKPGQKYKKMYEEQCKKNREAMLCLSQSGVETEHIMQLFGYTDRHQYYNAITKAKQEREKA